MVIVLYSPMAAEGVEERLERNTIDMEAVDREQAKRVAALQTVQANIRRQEEQLVQVLK